MTTASASTYEILKAKEHPLGRWFWKQFSQRTIQFYFKDLVIIGQPEMRSDASTFLISNHVSWWDGFWALEVNRRLWQKSYYVMMLEEQLKERQFLRYAGAFSVKQGHRSVLQSIAHSVELLGDPGNLLQIFPQGRIHSLYEHPVNTAFSNGTTHILKKVKAPVQVIFSVSLIDYFSTPRPVLYYYLEEFDYTKGTSLEEAYLNFYQRSVAQQVQKGE